MTPTPPPTQKIEPGESAATQRIDTPFLRDENAQLERLSRRGTMIGEYRVLEVIGRGGMGVVLVAEQLQPIRRQVALKLLASRRMDARAQAWFEVERQLLARMQHPAIAQIFDAGTTVDGIPYFSMELVAGEPLTRYADSHRLDLRERLLLFRRVCMGIHHAHTRGIIHRDLKPANILVAEIDGTPTPKIIDFGIAALSSQALDGSAPPAGTLPYMSPEQIARTGGEVDPRADVYALGVVLFELLTGERPYSDSASDGGTASTPESLLRSHDRATLRQRARERRIDPRRLLALLRGDLAAIMLKAVAADRAFRYESAAALADDLQRLVEHQPVSAVIGGRGYRLRRFARRHRLALSFALLAVAGLVGGLVLALQSARRAEAALQIARDEAATASAVADFFTVRVQGDDPGMQCNYEQWTAVGEATKRALLALDSRFAGQPRVEIRLRSMLATTLISSGDYTDALEQMRKARKQARTLLGKNDPDTLAVELDLVRVYNASERFSEALSLARSVANRATDLHDKRHPLVLAAQAELLEALYMVSRYDEARKLGERLLPLARARSPIDSGLLYQQVSERLSDTYRYLEMTDAAFQLKEERAALLKQNPGPRSERTLMAIMDIVQMEIARGNLDHAQTLFNTEVVPVYEDFCGSDNLPTYAVRLKAQIHRERGEFAQAASLLADWITPIAETPIAEQTMSEGIFHNEYGLSLRGAGKTEEAIAELLIADQIFARDLPVSDSMRQDVIFELYEAYRSLENTEAAAQWRQQLTPENQPEPADEATP